MFLDRKTLSYKNADYFKWESQEDLGGVELNNHMGEKKPEKN